ncbi:hypothetical protein FB451DRAFT_1565534 [Mycena latifolia]|nr:hypothetical protein FB451DRAFT_1565534 [Mycena latifolia]
MLLVGRRQRGADAQRGHGRAAHRAHVQPRAVILAGPASEGYALVPDDERTEHEEEGALCDIAPTVLALLGIPKPEEVTGRSLLAEKK